MTFSMNRRDFLAGMAAGAVIAVSSSSYAANSTLPGQPVEDLAEPVFRPLSLGSIRPTGWLGRQLRIQAEGLSGHLDEFWPDVAHSQWFGGKAEGWERAPYWLDGAIPLAWVLDDPALKAKVKGRMDTIIANQRPDGWFSPYPADASAAKYDLWSIQLINKVLAQYHEATGDAKVFDSMMKNLKAMRQAMDLTPLFNWGKFRWFEGLIPVYYAYEKSREPWLLDLAKKLRQQGFDYAEYYNGKDITIPTARRGKWTYEKHVVNTAMALKAYGLSWRLTRDKTEREFPLKMLEILDGYHGQVTGLFSGDECLSGPNPVQGTELCAVVESMYSLEHLISLTGHPAYGDRLERIAFNALPATFSPDMWTHQYDQQVNQVQCTINPDHMWSTNGPESNLFGLEPNYGCCTSNLHQGWPKFVAHLWMRTEREGIAAISYAPSMAKFAVGETPVVAATETDYPFRETVKVTITAEKAVRFPLMLRVPAWTQGATVQIGGDEESMKAGAFHRIEREWNGAVELTVRFPMKVKTTRRYHEAVAVERGPLVYSLKIGENWTRVNADKPHRELPHGDFEIRPTTPWNYGLIVDEDKPETSISFSEQPVGEKPFSAEGAGVVAKAKGKRLSDWKLKYGWADDVPTGIQTSSVPVEDITLIPYGCARLRVTEFPQG